MPDKPKPILLVIDDDDGIRLMVRAVLSGAGYEVLEAGNGRDGMGLAFTERPDVILLDRGMPGMDGMAVLRELRRNLVTRSIPVIMLTGRGKVADRVAGLRNGADDYVVKPFEPTELAARVESALRRFKGSLVIDPLTKLPGNPVLREELAARLDRGEAFSLCYADVNDFKAYVDRYGYESAGQVIQRLAQICYNTVVNHGEPEDFVGHIGGDDFIMITAHERAERLTRGLIDGFAGLVSGFYSAEDHDRGFVNGTDRGGIERRFPLVSLSVALIDVPASSNTDATTLAAFAARCKEDVKQRGAASPASWRRFVLTPGQAGSTATRNSR